MAKYQLPRAYFDLQLDFAMILSQKSNCPFGDAVLRYSNFFRRFGLDNPDTAASSDVWQSYTDGLETLKTHQERLEFTYSVYLSQPSEPPPKNQKRFGCFDLELRNSGKTVRTYFMNYDSNAISPLHMSKGEKRQQELKTLFKYIKENHPDAEDVQGVSWLYNFEAYRKLFPPTYGDSRQIRTGTTRFQGSSSWGQFLDYQGNIKEDLRNEFLARLKHLNTDKLWEVFPIPTLTVQSPIYVFYNFYGINDSA